MTLGEMIRAAWDWLPKVRRPWTDAARPRLRGRRRFRLGVAAPLCEMDSARRAALLLRACVCIRLMDLEQARAILEGPRLDRADAGVLNLLGAIAELRGQYREARRWYGQAIRADRKFRPPQENMRRLYELHTMGHSGVPFALGDEEPELWGQREQFLRRLEAADPLAAEAAHPHDN